MALQLRGLVTCGSGSAPLEKRSLTRRVRRTLGSAAVGLKGPKKLKARTLLVFVFVRRKKETTKMQSSAEIIQQRNRAQDEVDRLNEELRVAIERERIAMCEQLRAAYNAAYLKYNTDELIRLAVLVGVPMTTDLHTMRRADIMKRVEKYAPAYSILSGSTKPRYKEGDGDIRIYELSGMQGIFPRNEM